MSLLLKVNTIEKLNERSKELQMGSWKFVLSKEDGFGNLYALANQAFSKSKAHSHNDVVEHFNLRNILGGGHMRYAYGNLDIGDFSVDYGLIPNEAMNQPSNWLSDLSMFPIAQVIDSLERITGFYPTENLVDVTQCRFF